MNNYIITGILFIIASFSHQHSYSQIAEKDSLWIVSNVDNKLIQRLDNSYQDMGIKIDKQTIRYLDKLEKEEQKLRSKMLLLDSNKAKEIFSSSESYYTTLKESLTTKMSPLKRVKEYIPLMDSVQVASKFLSQFNLGNQERLEKLTGSIQQLQEKFGIAGNIKKMIQDRQQQLEASLSNYDIGKYLTKLNKHAYYFQQQINEYKSLLKDEQKLESTLLSIAKSIPKFSKFMQQNSQLSSLFAMPGSAEASATNPNLQTTASVQQILESRGAGINDVKTAIQSASSQLQGEKDKLLNRINNGQLGGETSTAMQPDFKPNNQKSKSFLKRLEIGFNYQSLETYRLFPITNDLAVSAGYKLNDRSVIGIGLSYKFGLGQGFDKLHWTHEGIGLRTYADLKWKKNFWLSGGYEQNYYKQFSNLGSIKYVSWQQSALLGLSKKIKRGKREIKLSLLYDFLQPYQGSLPVVFRWGSSL